MIIPYIVLLFFIYLPCSFMYSIGDVVPEERLPSADGGTRRVFERRAIPRPGSNAIHPGDELKPFQTRYSTIIRVM